MSVVSLILAIIELIAKVLDAAERRRLIQEGYAKAYREMSDEIQRRVDAAQKAGNDAASRVDSNGLPDDDPNRRD